MNSNDQFERAEELFQEGQLVPAEDRDTWLVESCGSDVALRAEVEALLEARGLVPPGAAPGKAPVAVATGRTEPARAAGTTGSDSTTAEPDPGPELLPPETIGPYRVLGELGSGVMGRTYHAKESGTGREVALKVLHSGFGAGAVLRRFVSEGELLSRLDHPSIARVLEARVLDDGRALLATELVAGQPLHTYAREHALDDAQRLRLFALICDAVQYAHQRGVIHRDLKPTNILVENTDAGPVPRLLDFGLARATGGDVMAVTVHANDAQLLDTVQAMSPEQAVGDADDVDTRSDVYSLGVILYELLSGERPYELGHGYIQQALRIIRDVEPRPLSTLDPRFHGDVETVVLKAMQKQRQRRYQSAADLALDVRRCLADEAIEAHPPSALYQLRKLAWRHRAFMTLAGAVVIGLAIGLMSVWLQWRDTEQSRALTQQRYEDVRTMMRALLIDMDGLMPQLPESLPARNLLVATALDYLDSQASEPTSDLLLQHELASAYRLIGDIQAGPLRGDSGRSATNDVVEAEQSYLSSLALLTQVGEADPAHQDLDLDRALVLSRLGDVQSAMGRFSEAFDTYGQARVAIDRELASGTELPAARGVQRTVLDRLGTALLDMGREDEALVVMREGLAAAEAVVAADPSDLGALHDLIVTTYALGALHQRRGGLDEALATFRQHVAMTEALVAAQPYEPVYSQDLFLGRERVGDVLVLMGRPAEALEERSRWIQAAAQRAELGGADDGIWLDLSRSYAKLGESYMAMGDVDAASQAFEGARSSVEPLISAGSPDATTARQYGVTLYVLADVARTRGSQMARSLPERIELWTQARRRFEECQAVFIALRERGQLRAGDARVPEEMAGYIEACDEALAELGAPR